MIKVILITATRAGFGRTAAETLALRGYGVFAAMRHSSGRNASGPKQWWVAQTLRVDPGKRRWGIGDLGKPSGDGKTCLRQAGPFMNVEKLLDTFIAWFIGTKYERDIKKLEHHHLVYLEQRERPLPFPAQSTL